MPQEKPAGSVVLLEMAVLDGQERKIVIETSRIASRALSGKVMSAQEAAALIPAGANVGMSGFTGAGYPKAVPAALVDRVTQARLRGDRFAVSVWTGASTAPELDGALAADDRRRQKADRDGAQEIRPRAVRGNGLRL